LRGQAYLRQFHDLQRRITIDFQELVERQRLGIVPQSPRTGRIVACELGFDQDHVPAQKDKASSERFNPSR
jgi:hypothetical protein